MAESYPLQWPQGWKRTQNRRSAPYKVTLEKAGKELLHTLELLGALRGSVVISSNLKPRALGLPGNGGTSVNDPGVAVYWTTKAHGERVVACDRWWTVRENVRAIGLALEGLRAMERAGATQILDRAFQAFGELPAAADVEPVRPWWTVLGFIEGAISVLSVGVIDARYRELAAKAHPDKGGSDAAMAELNRARDEARRHYGAA